MDFKENKPIYLQIVDKICGDIVSGVYQPETRIPSVREYAANLEVNANTVVRSFDFLQNKGIIYNKRGLGYFVVEGAADKILEMRREIFMKEQLNEFFNEIDMLNISINEIVDLYNKRNK
ncbi:MAG: GntR family transcriptional regulator [Bacteroidales bacterium]|nr:GntR family transcriptional regulator [Bacteroidales bacterium]MBR4626071.1 GntR family transcriptional regulator [Alphaproteobacteria bacterium]MBR6177708.1 GntR family transcriptional regulator [Bacteroidales bacterium]